jgi:hypothetical protein
VAPDQRQLQTYIRIPEQIADGHGSRFLFSDVGYYLTVL